MKLALAIVVIKVADKHGASSLYKQGKGTTGACQYTYESVMSFVNLPSAIVINAAK